MPRKKRPYKSKIKGCYECSQRRIDCDRSESQCQKCVSRGLKCSGLGVRHRFNDGVASRGRWTGKAMELAYQESYGRMQIPNGNDLEIPEDSTGTTNIREKAPITAQKPSGDKGTIKDHTKESLEHLSSSGGLLSSDCNSLQSHVLDDSAANSSDKSVSSDVPVACGSPLPDGCILFQPSTVNTPPWKSSMLLHFSNHIATEMVAIDGVYNGWRRLILPVAQGDELVMNAVLVVSAFHLSLNSFVNTRHLNHQSQQPNPEQLYARTILGLQKRRELIDCDRSTKFSVLLAILILLTAVMVTGHSDFPTLFRMLQSAVDAIGGEGGLGNGELAEFIIRQVHKMQVYGAPLLGEQTGRGTISSQTQMVQAFDCLNYCSWQHPEHSLAVSFVTDLVYQARDIYLGQVLHESPSVPPSPVVMESKNTPESINRVQHFKETLEAFPRDSPGEQVLVWASFVAASDCVLDEHKAFFKSVFLRHYARSGFVNLLRALEYLQKIWARAPGERWTSLLPQAKVFIM